MDLKVLNDISYGMFVITTKKDDKNIGCFINTVMQITSKNPVIAISLNKENYTNEILKQTKRCAISILSEKTDPDVISKFGYFSSKNIDKFENRNYQNIDNLPVILEDICGYMIGEVINIIDVETHDIFLIRIKKAKKISDEIPMTYKYYHEKLKGKAPKKAPTYQEENTESKANRYKCSICGYIYDDSKEKIKFEDLPDNWTCPMCGVGKDKFIKL
ncbi:MAG TPA: flavin reductase [Candidatus Faecimonas gallistercoris]|nr:flavin reductase [Candidatus Faecimonas gallistercoris]